MLPKTSRGGVEMIDKEQLKRDILLLFDLLTLEEQEAYVEEVRAMLIRNSRKAEFE